MRLDVYVAQYWPERSRSQWQKLIKDGRVFVDGIPTTDVNHELGEDDIVTVKAPKPPVLTGDIEVIYEDDDVLVMNKPSGTLSHAKGLTPEEFTIADFVRRHRMRMIVFDLASCTALTVILVGLSSPPNMKQRKVICRNNSRTVKQKRSI